MIPADLGLPPKFITYRRSQEDTILAIAGSEKRFSLLSAVTGSGKSAMYMSVASLLDARTLVLTSTKGLQQQLLGDFGPMGLTDIRGQGNYRCLAVDQGGVLENYGNPGTPCSDGPCHNGIACPLKGEGDNDGGCLYYDAVRRARASRLVVTNYAYWMTTNRFAEPGLLGDFDLIVMDEAHAAPDEIAEFCAIRIDRAELKSLIGLSLPPLNEGTEVWVDWANEALKLARVKYAQMKDYLPIAVDKRHTIQQLKRLGDLGRRLRDLSDAHKWRRSEASNPDVRMPGMQADWIAEDTPTGAVFSPVWAHQYTEEYLFKGVERIALVSAVLQKSITRYLGIKESQTEFIEVGSTFDPKRRPLIYIPTTRVDRNMNEGQVRQWMNRIDQIVSGRTDRKGVIHTRSYDRAKTIMARSKYRDLMLSHTSRDARDVIAQFKRAKYPCILVSPSVEEGHDFSYDQCRYQILTKVPFVDVRSALMQARIKSDRTYSNYLTALSLIQQVGRGMRAEDDWSENFIIDDHWSWIRNALKKDRLLPAWFIKSFVDCPQVPPPMNGNFGRPGINRVPA